MIEVHINGAKERLEPETTISAVLAAKNERPEMVAVEINGELVPKGKYGTFKLKSGDTMEFLHYMAGGAGR